MLIQNIADGRDARALNILPRLALEKGKATSLISFDGFTDIDDKGVTVFSIWPLTSDAPRPPGIDRWPNPGEAFVSPALAEDLTIAPDLFGKVVGLITPEGLETPRDRRVYMRPSYAAFKPGRMERVRDYSGLGRRGSSYGLAFANATDSRLTIQLVIAGAAIPSLILLAVAAGVDADNRTKRHRRLRLIGAKRLPVILIDLGEALLPVLLGISTAAVIAALTCFADLRLESLDTVFAATDVRKGWKTLFVVIVAAIPAALLVVLITEQRSLLRSSEQRVLAPQTVPRGKALLCIAAGIATVWLPAQGYQSKAGLVYLIGMLIFAVTVPALLAYILSEIGQVAASVGFARGWVGLIIGGRRLEAFPRRTSRLVSGVCVAVLLMGQVQLFTGVLSSQYFDAKALRAEVGSSILVNAGRSTYGPAMISFLEQLPSGVQPVWVETDPRRGTSAPSLISGTCRGLQALRLSCRSDGRDLERAKLSRPAQQVTAWLIGGRGPISAKVTGSNNLSTQAEGRATLVLASSDGKPIDRFELQQKAYSIVPGGINLEPLGQGWLTAATVVHLRSEWTLTVGSIALLLLAFAAALALAADVVAGSRDYEPLAALSEGVGWVLTSVAVRVAVPLIAASSFGALAYLTLASGFTVNDNRVQPSAPLALAAVIVSMLVAAGLTPLAVLAIRRRTTDRRHANSWSANAD